MDGEQARRMTERIAESAGTVVFSYAREVSKRGGEAAAFVGVGWVGAGARGL